MKYWMLLFALLWVSYGTGMARKTEKVVNNGIPWFDDRGAMLFRVSVVIHLMIW